MPNNKDYTGTKSIVTTMKEHLMLSKMKTFTIVKSANIRCVSNADLTSFLAIRTRIAPQQMLPDSLQKL